MAHVIELANVGMTQSGDGARFAVEALARGVIGAEMFGEDFYGDNAIEARIERAIDFAHAAHAELRLNLVWAELRTCRERHWRHILAGTGGKGRAGVLKTRRLG